MDLFLLLFGPFKGPENGVNGIELYALRSHPCYTHDSLFYSETRDYDNIKLTIVTSTQKLKVRYSGTVG